MLKTPGRPLVIVILAVLVGCSQAPPPQAVHPRQGVRTATRLEKIRPAAVAGVFYPAASADLKRQLDQLLADAKAEPIKNVRALVCPHAAYRFSAKTAAAGYRQVVGRDISTVILLGPSHLATFNGAFVSAADGYETPLGPVPLSARAAELARLKPLSANPSCSVVSPDWSRQSSRRAPARGSETPETWEYSLEVQLPFLQQTLKDFEIVPIVFGRVDPKQVAERLIPLLDDNTILVASSDLSHFQTSEEAEAHDARTIRAICSLDAIDIDDACGFGPIDTLIEIARQKGWKARQLDYRNSGEVTGDKSRVVGYAAIALFDPHDHQYSAAERRLLLDLARKSVEAAALGRQPARPDGEAPERLRLHRACFVTLTKDGRLRGCKGTLSPQEPLVDAVVHVAKWSAIDDPRFEPLQPDELKRITIEISVLSLPKALAFTSPEDLLAKLRPGIDGVVLQVGDRQATFLPQVWEELPDRRRFLNELAEKAKLPADAWTRPGAKVMTYQVEAIKEERGREKAEGGEEKAEGGRGKGE